MALTLYDLKPQFVRLLSVPTDWLAHQGVTANQVTVLALMLSIVGGALFVLLPGSPLPFWLLPPLLLIRMALNAIDGALARQYNMQSKLGLILNELGDVISDTALYLPFLLALGLHPLLVMTYIAMAIITEFAGVMGQVTGAGRRYEGPSGKSDRAFLMGLGSVLVLCGVPLGTGWSLALGALTLLLLLTTINRCKAALKETRT
jgi:CDP-diacylglycerol--glycerol-3-phosphate 3-phosphatidyltransferase